MKKSNSVAKSALLISMLTLGSKLLGFFREALIAEKYGSGMETDAFFVVSGTTALLADLMMNAIATTFVPILSEVEGNEGKSGKIKHANNMINVLMLISLLIAMFSFIVAPLIIRIVAKGFEGAQLDLAVKLLRIASPIIVFNVLSGSFRGYLQSEHKFLSNAITGYPLNFVYIFYLVLLSSHFGIEGLMLVAVIAVASQILVQIPAVINSGFKFKFIFNLKDKYMQKVLRLSLPVILGVAINDIGLIIDRTLASDLATGSISSLNYGSKLNDLVMGVFITAITTVIFPLLSDASSKNNIAELKNIMKVGTNFILLITIPATLGIVTLAQPIVEVAFERGVFTSDDTLMTVQALICYSLGLVALAIRLLLTRVYYSLYDTRTPMLNSIFAVVLNIILNLILMRYIAHAGLALATSISNTIATLILYYNLKEKIGSLGSKGFIKYTFKSVLASIVMVPIAYHIYQNVYISLGNAKIWNFIALLVAILTGSMIYLIVCYFLGIDEVKKILNKLLIRT